MKTPKLSLWALPMLFLAFALSMQSCQKDPIEKDPDPKGCDNQGTVAYLPTQCAEGFTSEVGILGSDGMYYAVREDRTGEFTKLKVGDKISYGFTALEEGCVVCAACTCPNPDICIILTCVNGIKPIPTCGTGNCDIPAKVVTYSYSADGNPSAGKLIAIDGKHYLVQGSSADNFNQLAVEENILISYEIVSEGFLPTVVTYPNIDGAVELSCINQDWIKGNH